MKPLILLACIVSISSSVPAQAASVHESLINFWTGQSSGSADLSSPLSASNSSRTISPVAGKHTQYLQSQPGNDPGQNPYFRTEANTVPLSDLTPEFDQDTPFAIPSLSAIRRQLKAHDLRVLDAELLNYGNDKVYRVKVIDRSGNVRLIEYNFPH